MAKFFESMLLALQFSVTLQEEILSKVKMCHQYMLNGKNKYLTKCWKMNFRTLKLTGVSFFVRRSRKASNRQLRSGVTEQIKKTT